jgi:CubicO group peptidase (beta-lactamase class C family)
MSVARVAVLALLTVIAATSNSSAQSGSPGERRAMATEHMLDTHGDEALRAYAQENLSAEYQATFDGEAAMLAHLRSIRESAGPVGGVGLMITTDGIRLQVSNRDRESVVLLRVQDQMPHLITHLELESTEAKSEGPHVTWDDLESILRDAEAKGFCGSVLAVHDGEVVLDRGYGFADPQKEHPVTSKTIFAIGSTPIDFTHAAILKLAQEGKLSLDDPITRYFDDVPEDKRGITLEHLRTGTSGLQNFHGIVGVDENLDLTWIDRGTAMRRIFGRELLFEPGTDEAHSHSAWGVLAAVIEIVSGQSYDDYLRENFFEPAGMHRTGPYPITLEFPASEIAVGLGGNVYGEVNSPRYWGKTSWLVLGSGGMVSTPRDLHRWRRFLESGKVLNDEFQRKYGIGGVFLDEGGNDRGFINTIGRHGKDEVIVCSNAHVAMDDATAELAMALARLATGE